MQKTVVITGAGSGIGKALALRFARAGYGVVISGRRREKLEEVAQEINASGGDVHVVAGDVSVEDDCRTLINETVQKYGRLDVLVNNAGIFLPGSVSEEADGVFEKLFFTNVASAYHLTRAILPAMHKSVKPHIFNMCSIASITAYANGGSYTISKFAMLGFSKVLREELKSTNIKVTSILPGPTWSDSWQGTDLPKERFTDPNDVAATIVNAYHLGDNAVIEEIIIRPQLGDI